MRRFGNSSLALAVAASLLQFSLIPAALAGTLPKDKPSSRHDKMQKHPAVTAQPDVRPDVARYFNDPDKDPELSREAIVKMLKQRIKYVFVIFNENHSFDNEYGTFPGANGLYSDGLKPRSAKRHAGFHPDLHGCHRLDRHRPAVQDRAGAELQRRRQRRPLSHRARYQDRRGSSDRRGEDGPVRLRRVHTLRFKRRGGQHRRRHAVRPARDVTHRLRHHPVLLAVGQPLHDIRQHFRDRGHALHPERGGDDRRPVG